MRSQFSTVNDCTMNEGNRRFNTDRRFNTVLSHDLNLIFSGE